MPTSVRTHYRSYLLRIWQETDGGLWRASLRPTVEEPTLYFASLEELAIFLL